MTTPPSAPDLRIAVHCVWWTAEGGPTLPPEAVERLVSYVTRYGQTLGVAVAAVGGFVDHLHLLFDLPTNKTLDQITGELRRTTARFLRDSMSLPGFNWAEGDALQSVGRDEAALCAEYVRDNAARHREGAADPYWEFLADAGADDEDAEEVPEWLRKALPKSGDV